MCIHLRLWLSSPEDGSMLSTTTGPPDVNHIFPTLVVDKQPRTASQTHSSISLHRSRSGSLGVMADPYRWRIESAVTSAEYVANPRSCFHPHTSDVYGHVLPPQRQEVAEVMAKFYATYF